MRLRLGSRVMAVDVALTVLALAFSGAVPFGYNLIVGQRYGPSVLGGVSVVLSLALFLGQIPGTLSVTAMKFLAEAHGRGDEEAMVVIFHFLLVLSLGLAGALALGLAALAPALALWLHVQVGMILLAAPLVAAYALYLFFKSVYYGLHSVPRYVVNEIASDVLFFVFLAGILLSHAAPWLLLPFVLSNAVFVARAVYDLAPYVAHLTLGRGAPRQAILRYSAVTGSGSIASIGRSVLGTTVAGLFLSHHAVGLYAAASTLMNPLYLLPQALSLVIFAAMARLHGAGDASSVRDLLQTSTEWLVIALGVVCGLVIVNAGSILTLLFHSQYVQATTTLQIVVLGAYLTMIATPSINALSSTAYVGIPATASGIGFATSLIAWLLLIPHLGITGIAFGFVAGAVATGGIPVYYALRLLKASPVAFLLAGALLAGLATTLALVRGQPLVASAVFVGLSGLLYLLPHRRPDKLVSTLHVPRRGLLTLTALLLAALTALLAALMTVRTGEAGARAAAGGALGLALAGGLAAWLSYARGRGAAAAGDEQALPAGAAATEAKATYTRLRRSRARRRAALRRARTRRLAQQTDK